MTADRERLLRLRRLVGNDKSLRAFIHGSRCMVRGYGEASPPNCECLRCQADRQLDEIMKILYGRID